MEDNYILGNLENEISRLETQSGFFEPLTRRTLVKAGIKEGMDCLDVGCGAGTVTRMMSQMVGKNGHVTGIDIDEKYIRYCQSNSLAGADFIHADISSNKLGKSRCFDIIYSRFMFVHLKDAKKALQSMKQLLRRGGALVIEELDHAPDSWLCYPENRSVDMLQELYVTLVKKAGGDPLAGRKIYRLMLEESFDTSVECNSPCLLMGHEPYNSLGWRIAESLKPHILGHGLLSEQEYADMHDDLKQLSADNLSFVTYARFFSVIGRKTVDKE